MKQKYISFIILPLILVLAYFVWSFYQPPATANYYGPDPYVEEDYSREAPGQPNRIFRSFDLPETVDFAGEPLPIHLDDVQERLMRELLVNAYWHSSTILNLLNGPRFFEVIEPILAKHGIPDDFKYLAVAESNLRNVTSPAGARGVWQFMPATGRQFGMEVNNDIDERNNLIMSTEAACQYLKTLYRQFNSWTLAAAAYNRGENGLRREIGQQRADSYYDLNLNEETMRYVFRIVAIKKIYENPEYYGFHIDESHYFAPLTNYRTLEVTRSIDDLAAFATDNGISYRDLKRYNPWLLSGTLPNRSGKRYTLHIPVQTKATR